MNVLRSLSAGALLLAVSLGTAGCKEEEKSPLERAGESVGDALDDAADGLEDAADKVKDATKDE